MKYVIKGKEIFTPNKVLKNTNLLINNGIIEAIDIADENNYEEIDMSRFRILPGLIDIHIHGANGYDTMDATYESLNEISKYLSSYGVTAFLATTVTAQWEKIINAAKKVDTAIDKGVDGAEIIGSYIEGPFITEKHKGAHPKEYIREISIKDIDELLSISKNIKIITIAPEKAHAVEIIRLLKTKGIITSIGHTNATYDETIAAIENGASLAVHTYNGMRGFQHREPGVVGAVLNHDQIYSEIISDMVHVHPAAIQILVKCKSNDKICLITDCMRAGGLKDGDYQLGELKVIVKDAIARIENGSLAGSTLKLINGIKNMVEKVSVEMLDAVNMASILPAKVIGIDHEQGSIESGKKANLTIVNDNFNVMMTMVKGKVVYNNQDHIA